MTKKENRGLAASVKEGGTEKRRRIARKSGQVAVYSECSVTVCIDPVHNDFLKITVGHERLSPSDSEADLKKTETAAWRFNEEAVERRVRRATRLIRQIQAESGR
jgi:hypothetical protein